MSEMMKNPDKIKQALKKCRDDKCVCDECTFSEGNVKKWRELMGCALEYIQNLEGVTEESILPVVQHVKQEMVLNKESTRTDEFTFIDGSVMRVTYELLKENKQ